MRQVGAAIGEPEEDAAPVADVAEPAAAHRGHPSPGRSAGPTPAATPTAGGSSGAASAGSGGAARCSRTMCVPMARRRSRRRGRRRAGHGRGSRGRRCGRRRCSGTRRGRSPRRSPSSRRRRPAGARRQAGRERAVGENGSRDRSGWRDRGRPCRQGARRAWRRERCGGRGALGDTKPMAGRIQACFAACVRSRRSAALATPPPAAAPRSGETFTLAWGGDVTLGSAYGRPPARGLAAARRGRPASARRRHRRRSTRGHVGSAASRSAAPHASPTASRSRRPRANAPALATAGVDVVNVANNHAFDYGAPGSGRRLGAAPRRGVALHRRAGRGHGRWSAARTRIAFVGSPPTGGARRCATSPAVARARRAPRPGAPTSSSSSCTPAPRAPTRSTHPAPRRERLRREPRQPARVRPRRRRRRRRPRARLGPARAARHRALPPAADRLLARQPRRLAQLRAGRAQPRSARCCGCGRPQGAFAARHVDLAALAAPGCRSRPLARGRAAHLDAVGRGLRRAAASGSIPRERCL